MTKIEHARIKLFKVLWRSIAASAIQCSGGIFHHHVDPIGQLRQSEVKSITCRLRS